MESAGITEIYSALIGNGVGGPVNFLATVIAFFIASIFYYRMEESNTNFFFFYE
jgi:hypothetical protein